MYRARHKGFTLIEVLVVVAIIGILAAVALPAYQDYVTRSKIQEATSALSGLRVRMEQYYQDNRRYSSDTGGGTCGLGATPPVSGPKYFTYSCASGGVQAGVGDQTYTITAAGGRAGGDQSMTGFTYTINQANARATTALPAGWGTAGTACWVSRKGGGC